MKNGLIHEVARDHTKKLIGLLTAALYGGLHFLLNKAQDVQLIKEATPLQWLRLTALLFLMILALIAYVLISYRNRLQFNKTDYEFREDPGYYINKKTNGKYCSKCFHEKKLCQLSIWKDGLVCRNCGEKYIGPNSYSAAFHADENGLIPTMPEELSKKTP